ncbi:hypothetical protein AB0N88_05260 [Streptomyces sp. NPDC093516]|uniref:hypothetical protein n=1 Tax=Streptomyces sp. NPDC093516 TaxID=3155304 RepID=UPI0034318DC7
MSVKEPPEFSVFWHMYRPAEDKTGNLCGIQGSCAQTTERLWSHGGFRVPEAGTDKREYAAEKLFTYILEHAKIQRELHDQTIESASFMMLDTQEGLGCMFTPSMKLRTAVTTTAMAAALTGLGAGAAAAAPSWPTLQPGAYLYSGSTGTGSVTEVDLGDFGTCHTLSNAAKSLQVANGSASVLVYAGAGCTGGSWSSGTLVQANLPWAGLSYRVVPAS